MNITTNLPFLQWTELFVNTTIPFEMLMLLVYKIGDRCLFVFIFYQPYLVVWYNNSLIIFTVMYYCEIIDDFYFFGYMAFSIKGINNDFVKDSCNLRFEIYAEDKQISVQ